MEKLDPQSNLEVVNLQNSNILQIKLAEAHGESLEDFVANHADQFREVIKRQPEFIERFQDDPEGVIREMGSILYH
jgi:hypothetical protein